ncbi:MAG: NADPH-dependent F420 reductase [Candidatus Binataceae bacterium]
MKIAIIGAGNVGTALAGNWAAKGHQIYFGVSDPNSAKSKAVTTAVSGARVGSNREAAAFGEVIVLAVPFGAAPGALAECGDLTGKIVLDCTNPLSADFQNLTMGFSTSGVESLIQYAKGASLFKTLNQTGFANMANPIFPKDRSVMFVAGDDAAKKPIVMKLVEDLGFEAIDAGDLKISRLLEPLAMLWIHLSFSSTGRDFAFGLLRR